LKKEQKMGGDTLDVFRQSSVEPDIRRKWIWFLRKKYNVDKSQAVKGDKSLYDKSNITW